MKPFRTVLVGCGGMGRNQARILTEHPDFELLAVCDIHEPAAEGVATEVGVKAYADFGQALAELHPEVAVIPAGNMGHAPLTIQAAEAGVKGIYCEKPMAMNMREARAMTEACEDRGVQLVINHQRRIGPDLVKMRALVEQGAIGTVERIRTNNAGDTLSDGTHAIDSLLWLLGDPDADWVSGFMHRDIDDHARKLARDRSESTGRPVEAGYRFGHPVEDGAFGVIGFKPDTNESYVKAEVYCGDMRDRYRAYQDYEIFGSKGRIWRTGDKAAPRNVFIDLGGNEGMAAELDEDWTYMPDKKAGKGPWVPVAYEDVPAGIPEGFRLFAECLRTGKPHPMRAEIALRGFELVMAIYESGRTGKKIQLPLEQPEFPLQLMLEEQLKRRSA